MVTLRDTCSLAQAYTVSKLQQLCDLKPGLCRFQSSYPLHLVQILPISTIILTFLVEISDSECVSPFPNFWIFCAHLCSIIVWRPLSWWGHSGLVLQTLWPSHLPWPPWPSHFSLPDGEEHTSSSYPRQLEPHVFLIKQPTGPHPPMSAPPQTAHHDRGPAGSIYTSLPIPPQLLKL